MAYTITNECVACGACEPECPVQAITEGAEKYIIEQDNCSNCGACMEICPMDAIAQTE